jgi:hypothetical protein
LPAARATCFGRNLFSQIETPKIASFGGDLRFAFVFLFSLWLLSKEDIGGYQPIRRV